MNATVGQILSLVSYGNDFLKRGNANPEYWPGNSLFKYCLSCDFIKEKKSFLGLFPGKIIRITNPNEWIKHLENSGVVELKAFYCHSQSQEQVNDHMMAGFIGGGGQWFIEAITSKGSEFWVASWDVTHKEAKDQRVWSVEYNACFKGKSETHNLNNKSARKDLEDSLKAIQAFASTNNLEFWANWFSEALKALDSMVPEEGFYHPDMLASNGHSLESRQLVFGAGKAFVFGGMGSWNDIGFNNEIVPTYIDLTKRLYEAVINAFLAGMND